MDVLLMKTLYDGRVAKTRGKNITEGRILLVN